MHRNSEIDVQQHRAQLFEQLAHPAERTVTIAFDLTRTRTIVIVESTRRNATRQSGVVVYAVADVLTNRGTSQLGNRGAVILNRQETDVIRKGREGRANCANEIFGCSHQLCAILGREHASDQGARYSMMPERLHRARIR